MPLFTSLRLRFKSHHTDTKRSTKLMVNKYSFSLHVFTGRSSASHGSIYKMFVKCSPAAPLQLGRINQNNIYPFKHHPSAQDTRDHTFNYVTGAFLVYRSNMAYSEIHCRAQCGNLSTN